jgi:hypothetical protein
VIWIAGILVLGLYWMYLQVTLAGDGELIFQGLLRRRSWHVAELRTVRPGNGCIVFKFSQGGAMVAAGGRDDGLGELLQRVHALNPTVRLTWPEMFRPPIEPNPDSRD